MTTECIPSSTPALSHLAAMAPDQLFARLDAFSDRPPETALEALELVEVLFIFSLEEDPQEGDLLDRAMHALRAGLRALHARTVLQSS